MADREEFFRLKVSRPWCTGPHHSSGLSSDHIYLLQKVQAAKQKRAAAAEAERQASAAPEPEVTAGENDLVSEDLLASKDEDVIF